MAFTSIKIMDQVYFVSDNVAYDRDDVEEARTQTAEERCDAAV